MRDSLIKSKISGFVKEGKGFEIITDIMEYSGYDRLEPICFCHGTKNINLYRELISNLKIFTDYLSFTYEKHNKRTGSNSFDVSRSYWTIDNKNIVAIKGFDLGKEGGF